MKIALNGALGRMGRRIAEVALSQGYTLVAPIDHQEVGKSYGEVVGLRHVKAPIVAAYTGGADVVIDFSLPEGLASVLPACIRFSTPLVSGTTGLGDSERTALDTASRKIPLISAYNMSLGVNLLLSLVKETARKLGPGYDIEIVEMHHRLKQDAPSGTAIALLQAACEATGRDAGDVARHGRQGAVGKRPQREIGLHAVRGGDVVGEHSVIFAGEGERVELVHKASSRDTFVRGALRAAEWIQGKPPGRYTMSQVLGL